MLPRALLLMGPTASGKSTLAMAVSRRLPVEIISVDSAQVYIGMDVGTAKPSPAERAEVTHHLIDVVSPEETYSAARFIEEAPALIEGIRARGRIPLLVGGTMLYFKALRAGLADLPPADPGVRAQIDAEAMQSGWPALHGKLATVDAATAARLKPNDAQRIQRALEVYRLSGRSLSEWLAAASKPSDDPPYLGVALTTSNRSELHRRIAVRFERMLEDGLIDELEALKRRYRLTEQLPSMRCVGYRQAWACLEGRIDRNALRERGIYATRQLAKRQLTWLRSLPAEFSLDCLDPSVEQQFETLLRSHFEL